MKFQSPIFGQASGSFDSLTFSHNRYGRYVRNRSIPVNPNSSRQQAARNRFSDMAERWTGVLTDAQRIAWNLYGASVTMIGVLGDPINLTGYSHYIRSNTAILQPPGPVVDAGPVIFTLAESDATFAAAISEATQLISVTFDDTKAWVDEDDAFMLVSMSQPRGVGRTFIGGPFRYADAIAGDSTTPPTTPATVAVPFVVVENQRVIVEARIVRADGRLSQAFQDTVSIAA